MIDEIRKLLDCYLAWLKDKTALREVNNWVEITTPYLDRHNDCLQIYAQRQNGGYLLTDGGYILEDLRSSGCKLDTPKRQDLLRMTLNGFGVRLSNDSLETVASPENFALRKHNLVQAMLAVNDMFYMAIPYVISLFYEDVVAWLDLHRVRYITNIKLTGKSGFDHHFEFVIPKSDKKPERILQTINQPTRNIAEAIAFSWIDTKDTRDPSSEAYAFLNDAERVQQGVIDALKSYEVKPILWSKREDYREDGRR